jgi:hypothetical protein
MSFVGVLMLDTQFPRPIGDIGNKDSFAAQGIPVRYQVIRSASPDWVVRQDSRALIPAFVEAAVRFKKAGAKLVTTSCGFLFEYQDLLQSVLGETPFLSSSLLHLADWPEAGVLTIDSQALRRLRLPQVVQGVAANCHFQTQILSNQTTLDLTHAEADVVAAAVVLKARVPKLREIVLECTNMSPYREAVARATGCEVHDIMHLIHEAYFAP